MSIGDMRIMKKKLKMLLAIIIGCFVFSITAFADEDAEWEDAIKNLPVQKESVLLPDGVNKSVGYGNAMRGNYMGSSGLGLVNKGYSVLGIHADTACHVPVKKIKMNIYLDRWNETEQDWIQVDAYSFTYEYKEGGEDLTFVAVDFDVSGFPANNYYRLRSFHAVWAFTGALEMQGPMTDGIKLTSGSPE